MTEWSIIDTTKGGPTIQKKKNHRVQRNQRPIKVNLISITPIFPSIPTARTIPQALHHFLLIMNQLVYQLTHHLRQMDNCIRLDHNSKLETTGPKDLKTKGQ